MGYTLTSNSLFGMVALSGLVINGSFVLTSITTHVILTPVFHAIHRDLQKLFAEHNSLEL